MLPLRARVDLGVMVRNKYSAFLKASSLLEPHHQIVLCHMQDAHWGSLTRLHRCSRHILQPHLTRPWDIWSYSCSNGYCHRKWTWKNYLKFWTRLFAFHIALIFSNLVWEKENFKFQPVKLHLKINLISRPAHVEGLGDYMYELVCWFQRLVIYK